MEILFLRMYCGENKINIMLIPGHALHEKALRTETKKRRHTGQQPRTNSGRRPADKPAYRPRINRRSIAGFIPPSVCIKSTLPVLPNKRSHSCLRCPGSKRDSCFLGAPTRRRPVLPSPAPPRRLAVCRSAPTRL